MAFIYNLKKRPINTIPKVIWEMNAETYQVKRTNVSTPHIHTTQHTTYTHIPHLPPIHTTIHPTHLKPHTYTPYTRTYTYTHIHKHIDTPHAHTHIPIHNTTHTYTQRQRSDRHSVL